MKPSKTTTTRLSQENITAINDLLELAYHQYDDVAMPLEVANIINRVETMEFAPAQASEASMSAPLNIEVPSTTKEFKKLVESERTWNVQWRSNSGSGQDGEWHIASATILGAISLAVSRGIPVECIFSVDSI